VLRGSYKSPNSSAQDLHIVLTVLLFHAYDNLIRDYLLQYVVNVQQNHLHIVANTHAKNLLQFWCVTRLFLGTCQVTYGRFWHEADVLLYAHGREMEQKKITAAQAREVLARY
jgi:hypothetical protein